MAILEWRIPLIVFNDQLLVLAGSDGDYFNDVWALEIERDEVFPGSSLTGRKNGFTCELSSSNSQDHTLARRLVTEPVITFAQSLRLSWASLNPLQSQHELVELIFSTIDASGNRVRHVGNPRCDIGVSLFL